MPAARDLSTWAAVALSAGALFAGAAVAYGQIGARLDSHDRQFGQIEHVLERLDQKLDSISTRCHP